jgi:hypothetical protein
MLRVIRIFKSLLLVAVAFVGCSRDTSSKPADAAWQVDADAPEWTVDPEVLGKLGANFTFAGGKYQIRLPSGFEQSFSLKPSADFRETHSWSAGHGEWATFSILVDQ